MSILIRCAKKSSFDSFQNEDKLPFSTDSGQWSMVESVKIEWNFCPETPDKVDFFPGMSCPAVIQA